MGSGKAHLLGFCFASECFVLGAGALLKRRVSFVICPLGHLNPGEGVGWQFECCSEIVPAPSGFTVDGWCGLWASRGVGTAVPLGVILDLPLANSCSEVFLESTCPWHW